MICLGGSSTLLVVVSASWWWLWWPRHTARDFLADKLSGKAPSVIASDIPTTPDVYLELGPMTVCFRAQTLSDRLLARQRFSLQEEFHTPEVMDLQIRETEYTAQRGTVIEGSSTVGQVSHHPSM
jgi:hypothetical protein